jgi:hypothetical protein
LTGVAPGLHADVVAGELAVRFLLGGAIVSAFAAIGAVCKPTTLAGIFGSAPSVALVTLALAFTTHGASYAATECASMAIGAVGLVAYCLACAAVATRVAVPIWMGAAASWLVWGAVAFGLWALVA